MEMISRKWSDRNLHCGRLGQCSQHSTGRWKRGQEAGCPGCGHQGDGFMFYMQAGLVSEKHWRG